MKINVDENTLSIHDEDTDRYYQYHLSCVEHKDKRLRYKLTKKEIEKINGRLLNEKKN